MWSCRFWAGYVLLYFFQLYEENRILNSRHRALIKKNDNSIEKVKSKILMNEMLEIKKERKNLAINAIINAAYFPLTLHWSLEKGYLADVGVGVCGTVASVCQIYSAWKAT